MNTHLQFPDDENGDVLRRMQRAGDDLSQERLIDFCFVFTERKQALAFASRVDDPSLEICVSFFQQRKLWQAIVKRLMVPDHGSITALELDLAVKADAVGGKADGWGCLQVSRKIHGV